ncbi:MAG: hypothetical protein HWD59_04015 [Coxiellaceae bacterium]|nr:MAG: hypothetical protein HWD59_04015 [Coxiellaceae bacterium]
MQQQIKDLQQKDDIKTAKIIELEQQKQHLDEKINELEEALLQQQAAATKQSMETAKEITKKTDYVAMEPSFKIDFNLIPFLILPPAIKDLMKQFEAQGYHILLTGSATYSNNPSDYDFITDAPEPNKILPCAASPDKLGLSQLFHDQLQMPIDISYRPTEVFTNIEKFQQEAKSRVINSDTLFVDSDGNGYDPLQCGVAVTSGDNACEFIDGNDELLKNDPIQILRIIRRCAENNFLLGASSIQLIKANAKYVSQLKPREFWQEMSKLLLRGFAHQSFVLLHTTNVLESLFPDYQVTFITDQRYKNVILNLLTMLQNIDHKPSMEALCGHLFAGSLIWAIKKEQIPTKNFPQKLDTLINQSLFACFNIEEIKTTALQIAPNFLPKSHYGSKPRNYAPTVFDQKPTTAKPVQQKSTSQATKSVVKVKPTEETTINTTTTAKTM